MADELIAIDGCTYFHTDDNGDVEAREAKGYFFRDVRHLSRWELRLDEQPLQCLRSSNVDYWSARFVLALPGDQPRVTVTRDRFVTDGVHEDLLITNHDDKPRKAKLEVLFDSDFADIMEARDDDYDPDEDAERTHETNGRVSLLHYRRDGFERSTRVSFSKPVSLEDGHAIFELTLPANGGWHCCIDIEPVVEGRRSRALRRCDSFGEDEPNMPIPFGEWMSSAPTLETDWDDIDEVYRASLRDLAALRIRPEQSPDGPMPAGGMPWYMAIFGRDSIWTAFMTLPIHASLAHGTLGALAANQATDYDDYRDAEPGKILHELRRGKLAQTGDWPNPYYGTHDATPLFLVLLDEYERWTGDTELVRKLEPSARAALAWIEGPGDLDGDGYLEYRSRSPKGLDHHCWKDSDDGVLREDGSSPDKPLALCEVQGYAYDARIRTARLAREVWGDDELARRLTRDARELKRRFNEDFWDGRRRMYALALDARKQKVMLPASNMGHLLFSGIVDEDRAEAVVRRLLRDDLFNGWGIRTVSSDVPSYSPLRYHNGTVWPHDTAICAEGMRRYGFREEASRLAFALVEAAVAFEHRPPECFAGFSRDRTRLTVQYPAALRPQAWAAAAMFSCLRTLFGLDVVNGKLRARRALPVRLGRSRLRGLRVRGKTVDA